MKESWSKCKFDDVVDIVSGRNQKDVVSSNGKYPIYGSGGIIGRANNFLCRENTTIIGRKGNINSPIYVKEKFWNIDTAFGLESKTILEGKLLFYYCLGFNFKQLDKSTAVPSLAKRDILNIEIPLPPLPEQRAIVAKIEQLFSELDNGIANLKTAQEQLRVYRHSVLNKALGSFKTFKPIGKIFDSIVPNRDKPKSFSGNIKWVTIPNLNQDSIKLVYNKNNLGLTDEEVQEFRAKIIPINSVIMTCVGTFGNSAIVQEEIVINQQLHAFLPNIDYSPKFVAYYIMFSKPYYDKQSTSTTISYLNKSRCNSLPFPIVELEEQHQIVQQIESRLSVCDKVEETIAENLQKAEALRQSILKKAFAGELLTEAEIAKCKKEKDWEPAGELLKRIKKEK